MLSASSLTLRNLQGEVWKRGHTDQSLGDSVGDLEGHGREQSIRWTRAADEEETTADIGLQNRNWPPWVHEIWRSPSSCGPNHNEQSSKFGGCCQHYKTDSECTCSLSPLLITWPFKTALLLCDRNPPCLTSQAPTMPRYMSTTSLLNTWRG